MNALIESRRTEVEELCRRFRVKTLEVFGSAAAGELKPRESDLDFIVEFEPSSPGEHADAYFEFLFALEELFDRKIDLVEAGAATNPYFLQSIEKSRALLYAA